MNPPTRLATVILWAATWATAVATIGYSIAGSGWLLVTALVAAMFGGVVMVIDLAVQVHRELAGGQRDRSQERAS